MTELIIGVSAVVLISALCSLCEAALYSIPISHIESLVQNGHSSGRILKKLRKDVDRPIAAILSLNTIANTAGAAVVGAAAVNVLGPQWLAYFSAFLTLMILVFSEVVPKTAGVVYSRALAPLMARPLQLLIWLFLPIIWFTSLITRIVSRGHSNEQISEEELVVMARLGLQTGAIHADEAEVIQNILVLKSKKVRDIMTPRTVVSTLAADFTVGQAHELKELFTHSRIPVYDGDSDNVIGLVYRRDVLTAWGENRSNTKMEELMTPIHFVADSLPLDRLLRTFLERRQHLFAAISEFGGFTGIVTLEDVLEEILGREIVDEFDQVADMREIARRRRQQILKT